MNFPEYAIVESTELVVLLGRLALPGLAQLHRKHQRQHQRRRGRRRDVVAHGLDARRIHNRLTDAQAALPDTMVGAVLLRQHRHREYDDA